MFLDSRGVESAKTVGAFSGFHVVRSQYAKKKTIILLLGRHGNDSLCRDERENKMAATYNI